MSKYCSQNIIDPSSILVLKDKSTRDVAEALIKSGSQREPFIIFDFDTAYQCVQRFRTKMPRVQLFYAMKANDHSMMVKLAIALGLGFDCASPGEINKIRQLNVSPTSIIYAMPIKTREQMEFARSSGVRHTTIDSLDELHRLKLYWPDARLLVRIKLESESVYKLGEKFGCEFHEAVTLLDQAAKLNITVIGIAFHVGSICFSKESYSTGLRIVRDLFDYEASNGRKLSIVDIGGGFFCHDTDIFDQVADVVNESLEKWFPDTGIQIISEPGRYLCETAFTFYTGIKEIRRDTSKNQMVYLCSGIFDSLPFIEKWHTIDTIEVSKAKESRELFNTILWGPSPDDKDFFGPLKMKELSSTDWLSFHKCGAYNDVFKSKYCYRGKNLTLVVTSLELWNKLKHAPVFSSCDAVTDVLPSCLPTTLPPLVNNDNI